MLGRMKPLIDAFWRAALYCMHPRVIALSVMPLILMVLLTFGIAYFFWAPAQAFMQVKLDSWAIVGTLLGWMEHIGLGGMHGVLAPMVLLLVMTPAVVLVSLLTVAAMITPAVVSLVAERRFPQLERQRGGSTLGSVFGSLALTAVAVVLIVASMPLWFVPPFVLILPPLIWGWLTYRVLTYDVLSDHASAWERRQIMKRHRGPLLAMGVITGYLGAAPSMVWASGVLFTVLAPVMLTLAIWIYTLVFAFSSLWFAHYALGVLQSLRKEAATAMPVERVRAEALPDGDPAAGTLLSMERFSPPSTDLK